MVQATRKYLTMIVAMARRRPLLPTLARHAPMHEQAGGFVPTLDVQGHRGARGLKPENTLPAFEAALDLEVDTLELDLHLDSDDRIIVWHDAHVFDAKCASLAPELVRPTSQAAPADGARIRRLGAAALDRLRCTRNPDPSRFPDQSDAPTLLAGDDYRIVSLAELFEFVARYALDPRKSPSQRANAARVRFNLETKRKREAPRNIDDGFDGLHAGLFERRLVTMVQMYGLTNRVTVQSLVPESLWAVASLEPALELSVLEDERLAPLTDYAARGATVWSPRAALVDEHSVAEARAAGLQVKPWTVNEPTEMVRLLELGVDGIITDRPDVLKSLLHRKGIR